jgi:hypothetical protein
MGIIYLIQPKELIGTNRYKIGCSKKDDNSRLKTGYKKGSDIIQIFETNIPNKIENIIINIFKIKFNIIAGNEYFEGNRDDIINTFINIYNLFIKNNLNTDNNSNYNTNLIKVSDYMIKYKINKKIEKFIRNEDFIIENINIFLKNNIKKVDTKNSYIKLLDIYELLIEDDFYINLTPKEKKIYNKKFFYDVVINKTELSKYYIKRIHNIRNYIKQHTFI